MAIVAVPVVYKLATGTHDPMNWGFTVALVFLPAAAGSVLGGAVTALRRWRLGPSELTMLNLIAAAMWAIICVGLGLFFAFDL